MIFPIINGIIGFSRSPVVWILFVINLAMFLFTETPAVSGKDHLGELYSSELFFEIQGRIYSEYVRSSANPYDSATRGLANNVMEDFSTTSAILMGKKALRDYHFKNNYIITGKPADPILFGWWKKKFDSIIASQNEHPSYHFGVGGTDTSAVKWISYQFTHNGFMHFLSNMLFFFIFGCALEVAIGGLAVLIVYISAGCAAAGFFLFTESLSSIPLVGASGAVSGIMALFCMLFWKRPVRYIYFLFIPRRGYAGFVYLPAGLALMFWMIGDLAGYIGTPVDLGGVAHISHIGGQVIGVFTAFILLKIFNWDRQDWDQSRLPATAPPGTKIC